MKASELEGALLDYWVGRAVGGGKLRTSDRGTQALITSDGFGGGMWVPYSPSTEWAQGGPIIERELIELAAPENAGEHWMANLTPWPNKALSFDAVNGPTPLVAAMRAYVASKLGDEIGDVPPSDRTPFGIMA